MPEQDSKAPIAFLSYAHRDDQQTAGRITQLREALQLAVSTAVGEDFEIFQDCDAIAWGKQWQGHVDDALGHAQFLIPIVTPSYFKSGPCREELEKFAALERRARRIDLILPLYFRTVRDFNSSDDPLVQLISRRQYRDWREVRNRPLDDPEIRQQIDKLADELGESIAISSGNVQSTQGLTAAERQQRLAASVTEPGDLAQLLDLRARVDKLEEERTEREATISALQSARTTLEEELAKTRQEGPASAGATPEPGPTRRAKQPDGAGPRAWLLTAASALALGIAIGGIGVWVAMEGFGLTIQADSEPPTRGDLEGLKNQLRERQTQIAILESRAAEAEARVAGLENRLVAERREKEEFQRQLGEARASDQEGIALAFGQSGPWRDCEECPWMIRYPAELHHGLAE